MSILFGLPYQDRLGNDIYTDFRNMLRLETLSKDPTLTDLEKSILYLRLLYGDDIPKDTTSAFGELIWFYHKGEIPKEKPKSQPKLLFDFDEDSPYIMAAFLACYHIDLSDINVTMHWWQFMDLFLALPEATRMAEIISTRAIDTSKMKGEQKKFYEERKKAVALKSVKAKLGSTFEERSAAKQKAIDELYAKATKQNKH